MMAEMMDWLPKPPSSEGDGCDDDPFFFMPSYDTINIILLSIYLFVHFYFFCKGYYT
jgi:hypothetical protein